MARLGHHDHTTDSMNIDVTVSCPDCAKERGTSPFVMQSTGIHLTLFDTGVGAFYTFFCPHCYTEVSKPADDSLVGLMLGYVPSTLVHVPDEMGDENRAGPPISSDDVMDFIIELYGSELRATDQIYREAAEKVRENN